MSYTYTAYLNRNNFNPHAWDVAENLAKKYGTIVVPITREEADATRDDYATVSTAPQSMACLYNIDTLPSKDGRFSGNRS